MPNYKVDALVRLLQTIESRQTDEEQLSADENVIEDQFQPMTEKLMLSDTVSVTLVDVTKMYWATGEQFPHTPLKDDIVDAEWGTGNSGANIDMTAFRQGWGAKTPVTTTVPLPKNASVNVLFVEHATAADYGTGGLYGMNHSSGAQESTIVHSGSRSLKVTATTASVGVGPYVIQQGNVGGRVGPLTPGQAYTYSVFARDGVGSHTLYCSFEWYDSGGARITTTGGTAVQLSSTTWTRVSVTGTAPANAVYCTPTSYTGNACALNDVFYVDSLQLEKGTAATPWVRPYASVNLLNMNQATGGDDLRSTSGFGSYQATNTWATEKSWNGFGSIKATSTASTGDFGLNCGGVRVKYDPARTYAISAHVLKGLGDHTVYIKTDYCDSNGTYITSSAGVATVQLSDTWQRIFGPVISAPANAAFFFSAVYARNAVTGDYFYVDGWQIEEGPAATPFSTDYIGSTNIDFSA